MNPAVRRGLPDRGSSRWNSRSPWRAAGAQAPGRVVTGYCRQQLGGDGRGLSPSGDSGRSRQAAIDGVLPRRAVIPPPQPAAPNRQCRARPPRTRPSFSPTTPGNQRSFLVWLIHRCGRRDTGPATAVRASGSPCRMARGSTARPRPQLKRTATVSPVGEPETVVTSTQSQCSSGTTEAWKLVTTVPVVMPPLVLLIVIGVVVTVVPAAEASGPWRRVTLTLGLLPPLSRASRRLRVRDCGALKRIRRSPTWGFASQICCGAIGPGGPSREASCRQNRSITQWAYEICCLLWNLDTVGLKRKIHASPVDPVQFDAAPKLQAGSLGWRSRELVVACPLKGLVRLPEHHLQSSFHSLSSSLGSAGGLKLWFIEFARKAIGVIGWSISPSCEKPA